MQRRVPTPLALAILLMIAAACGGFAYFGDTIFKQARRMKLGYEFLPGITNVVYAHPEFRGVRVGVGTAKTGCFLVGGMVETHEQFAKLQRVIAGTKPPLPVVYQPLVLEDYAESQRDESSLVTNRNPSIHPGTNRTAPATGDQR